MRRRQRAKQRIVNEPMAAQLRGHWFIAPKELRLAPTSIPLSRSGAHDLAQAIQEVFLPNGVDLEEGSPAATRTDSGAAQRAACILEERHAQADAVSTGVAVALKHPDAAAGLTVCGDKIAAVLQRGGDAARSGPGEFSAESSGSGEESEPK